MSHPEMNMAGYVRRAIFVAILLMILGLGWRTAQANPTGGTVAQGTATFSTSGSQLTINAANNTFINWQSFNIGVGETTTFVQPSSSSLVWNQINNQSPAQILGNLNANGYVVLQSPSGFYIGGQACIATHGVMMTTSPIRPPDVSGGGTWEFDAPPPTAKIINYGQINIAGGGPAFLIANDIENNGTISAPSGKIGLYAGEKVLVSASPDGRGLSAEVTLPRGSVDNNGKLIADAGSIAMQAQMVNQSGLIQADSVRNVNGTIELLASDAVNLNANSVISAQGDTQGTSSGGCVTIKSGNTFSDQPGSVINISGGAQGGNGGQVEISAPQIGSIQSTINGRAADGFIGGTLTIDPANIWLASAATDPNAPANYTIVDVNSYNGLSQITLQADNNIELSTVWTLADPGVPATLNLTAGNNITLDDGSGIKAGNNWSITMAAGTGFVPTAMQPKPISGNDGVYLNGSSYVQTQGVNPNDNITISAANEVIVQSGAIRTLGGGNISVTTEYGDVNSGDNVNGYLFGQKAAPYYKVNAANLGGISTAAGGNVTINAGGDVISYLPVQSDYVDALNDAGTGAFGSLPGNVTITAGGSVYGHYVLANGFGTISAGGNIGAPLSIVANNLSDGFALSLINGSWNVYAPNGSIYVQDVRNPNGIFGEKNSGSSPNNYAGYHAFDYGNSSSVLFDAGDSVEITGYDAPNTPASTGGNPIASILPPVLQVMTGSGGFILDTSVILFPSPDQGLKITTTDGGNFGIPNSINPYSANPVTLEMSDSGASRWVDGNSFGTDDHASTPSELGDPNPVQISISGNINDVNLYTTEKTQMTVGGDIINSGFVGENLHPGDTTSITVTGQIFNSPYYTFVTLNSEIASANPLDSGAWDSVFYLAVNPKMLASLLNLNTESPQVVNIGLANYLIQNNYILFPNAGINPTIVGRNPGFVYDPTSLQLGFQGNMSQILTASQISALEGGTFMVLVANSQGIPIINANGYLETTAYNFSAAPVIAALYNESLMAATTSTVSLGYQIGGPGHFVVQAASIVLGNSAGIGSDGFGISGLDGNGFDYSSLQTLLPVAADGGASVTVTVTGNGNLSMATSAIYSRDGGDVNVTAGGEITLSQGTFVFPTDDSYGIYTSGHSDVNVTAGGNINIGSARIATFDGGNVFVESYNGDVDAGSGVNVALIVYGFYLDPTTGFPSLVQFGDLSDVASLKANPAPYGSGVLAEYPTAFYQSPGGKGQPGDITITTPNGNIVSTLGGISQFALDQSISGNPMVTLTAGTTGIPATADQGNISLGLGGVVGGTITVNAGFVQGLIVSRQNANINAVDSFNGTVLSGGSANFSGGGTVSGTVVGIGGINVSGGGTVTATLLSQNVTGVAGASDTLGSSANATSASQSAAGLSSNDTKQQVASNDTEDDKKKKKKPLIQHIGRVTVILSSAVPSR